VQSDLSPGAHAALKTWAAIATASAPDATNPAIAEFRDQFTFDVSSLDDAQREAFFNAAGNDAFGVSQQIYVHDMTPRLRSVLAAVLDIDLPHQTDSVDDLWAAIEAFMVEVARLDSLDPALTELIRLRGARLHDCAVCKSRRSRDAIDAGATDADFSAVDDWPSSNLPPQTKAALGLVDAMVLTPSEVPRATRSDARQYLSDEQVVEVLLDVVRNAANKIAVALGADAATVTDGVELFVTDSDGNLVVV
jgi:alkylhydroperoxidase family enzyme